MVGVPFAYRSVFLRPALRSHSASGWLEPRTFPLAFLSPYSTHRLVRTSCTSLHGVPWRGEVAELVPVFQRKQDGAWSGGFARAVRQTVSFLPLSISLGWHGSTHVKDRGMFQMFAWHHGVWLARKHTWLKDQIIYYCFYRRLSILPRVCFRTSHTSCRDVQPRRYSNS